MSNKRHLIIGAGPAALSAVDAIRQQSADDEIRLVSREETLPYSPAILPYLLAGRTTEKNIWLRNEAFFRAANVEYIRDKEVSRIIPSKQEVAFKNGDVYEYDSLLIASGAEPLTQPVNGLNEDTCQNFRSLADYRKLNNALKKDSSVAILGAGMVAIELSMALAERGNKVQIIGRGRPLRAYFDEKAGGYISDILSSHGVKINTGKAIEEVKKTRGGIEIICTGGDTYKADLLIYCLGVSPALSLIEGSGIAANHGILVDDRMRTNIDGVYAAGDVAEAPDFFLKQPGISAILPSAIAQGKVAGTNMAGKDTRYEGWLSINQFKIFRSSAASIGLAMSSDKGAEVMEENSDSKRSFKRMVFKDNRLIGAMFINTDVDPGIIRYLVESRVDVSTNMEKLFAQPKEVSRWLIMENERRVTV